MIGMRIRAEHDPGRRAPIMTKKRNNRGFSMAELMITVAILAVLAGLAVVGVIQYQRSMQEMELSAIAKQIFISAQNHLSLVDSQGFLELSNDPAKEQEVFGYPDSRDEEAGKYFFVYGEGNDPFTDTDSSLLDLILPFGSVEEAVRTGGSFVIHYQKSPAMILDVFYASKSGRYSFDFSSISFEDKEKVTELMSYVGEDKKSERRNAFDGSVIGWYGGDDLETGRELKSPSIVIKNGDKLEVEVTVADQVESTESIQLVVAGLQSKAKRVFDLKGDTRCTTAGDRKYIIVLDDITAAGMHFAQIPSDDGKQFYPGENIAVQAKLFSTTEKTNVATSERKVTNSLFDTGSVVDSKKDNSNPNTTVYEVNANISNIRHLENLGLKISNCGADSYPLTVATAGQTKDLAWDAFWRSAAISPFTGSATAYHFCPVTPATPLSYDGRYHKITGIDIDESGDGGAEDAGLFGRLEFEQNSSESAVVNLELVDTAVKGKNSAGALIGAAMNVRIENVLARSSEKTQYAIQSNGESGGLVGKMTDGKVISSAAVMTVSGANNVGGLVGSTDRSTEIRNSYSAGHTDHGEYYVHNGNNRAVPYGYIYNVKATGNTGAAGGLVGSSAGTISDCYSTCSVSGNTAGGFVGTASGTIANCYCTGLVEILDGKNNAFIDSGTPSFQGNNRYYDIINEVITDSTGIVTISYKGPGNAAVEAIDTDPVSYSAENPAHPDHLAVYNDFLGNTRETAVPYDTTLGRQYHLLTVEQLLKNGDSADTIPDKYYVKKHYGDWPTPDGQVVNIKG